MFKIDIETCEVCGGAFEVIASIEDPVVIEKILAHLRETVSESVVSRLPARPTQRAPPDLWS